MADEKNTLCNFGMNKIGVNVEHCVGSDHAPSINSGDDLMRFSYFNMNKKPGNTAQVSIITAIP